MHITYKIQQQQPTTHPSFANMNVAVMCIPKMDARVSPDYILSWFHKKNIGRVEKLIELPHKNNPTNKRIILHVLMNESSENAKIIKERFSQKQDVKLIHNLPWDFWKIVEANNKCFAR